MARPETILVVGGGIAGMTAAAALAQQGFAVTLLEAAREFGDIGAGVTLSPNAMLGLDFIGVMRRGRRGRGRTHPPAHPALAGRANAGARSIAPASAKSMARPTSPSTALISMHELLKAARDAGVDLRTGARVVASEGNAVTLADGSTVSSAIWWSALTA